MQHLYEPGPAEALFEFSDLRLDLFSGNNERDKNNEFSESGHPLPAERDICYG